MIAVGRRAGALAALAVTAGLMTGCTALSDAADSTGSGTVAVACSAVRVTAQSVVTAAKEQLAVATDGARLASALEALQERVDGLAAKFSDASRLAGALDELSAALGTAIVYGDALAAGEATGGQALADAQQSIDEAAAKIATVCDEG